MNDEKFQILRSLHEKNMYKERKETYCQIADCYWWKKLYQNVKQHVKSCIFCQLKALKKKKKKLHSMYVSIIWEKIRMNVIHMLFSHNYNYLIIAKDNFFKWMKWKMIINVTVKTIVKFLWEDIFCRYSIS